jgi:hypothetical protein
MDTEEQDAFMREFESMVVCPLWCVEGCMMRRIRWGPASSPHIHPFAFPPPHTQTPLHSGNPIVEPTAIACTHTFCRCDNVLAVENQSSIT